MAGILSILSWDNTGAEVTRRLPDGVVQIGRAVADGAVKLSRDEARLAFHERRVVLAGLEKARLISPVQREQIHVIRSSVCRRTAFPA